MIEPTIPVLSKHDMKVITRTLKHFGLQHSIDTSLDGDWHIDICGYQFSIERESWTEELESKSLRGTQLICAGVDGWHLTKWIDGEDHDCGRHHGIDTLIGAMVQEAVWYRAHCIDREEDMAEDYASRNAIPQEQG